MAPGAHSEDAPDHLVERPVQGSVQLDGGFLTVCLDTVSLPDGSLTTRQYIRHPGAVAVIPLLDDGRVVMVRQYRYPIARVLIELPAGKLDPGETVMRCAARELVEETGYTAREWAYAGAYHNAAAYSTEVMQVWFARGLQAGAQQLDHGEFVEVSDAEMKRRLAKWRSPKPQYTSGVMAKYARLVSSASEGAVTG